MSARVGRAMFEYRDGVHLLGTVLWFDATRTRDVAVLTSALAARAGRHRQYITTAETARLCELQASEVLIARPHRPFSLGSLRIELFGSGYLLGAASALVEMHEQRIVFAGEVNPAVREGASLIGHRTCQTLVLDSRFGHPRYRFPARPDVLGGILEFARSAIARDTSALLLCAPLGGAQELIRALTAENMPVRAHRRIARFSSLYRELGVALPEVPVFRSDHRAPHCVLWPMGEAVPKAFAGHVALASGYAHDLEALSRVGTKVGFPLAEAASHEELCEYVAHSEASEVHVTGLHAKEFVGEMRRRGLKASALGPPQQMDLFRR